MTFRFIQRFGKWCRTSTYLAIVKDMRTVEIVNVELFGNISDQVVQIPFDASFDRV